MRGPGRTRDSRITSCTIEIQPFDGSPEPSGTLERSVLEYDRQAGGARLDSGRKGDRVAKRGTFPESRPQRGMLVVGILALSVAALGIAALALVASGPSTPTANPAGDPLASARIALFERDYTRAEAFLKEFLQGREKHVPGRILLARALLGRGRLAEARETFTAVQNEEKNNIEAVRGLAETHEALNQPDLAATWWRRAASINSKDAEPQIRLARVLKMKADFVGALGALHQARAIDPKREDVEALMQEVLAAQTGAPAHPPGIPNPASITLPARPQAPNPRTSVPIPQPPDPLKGYPTGGNPR